MTPRPRVDADPVATATMERIGRDFKEQPPKARGQWGMFALALAIGYLAATLASKQNSEGPVASRLRSEATPQATPPPPLFIHTPDPLPTAAPAMTPSFDPYQASSSRYPLR